MATTLAPASAGWRGELARAGLTALLVVALLLPLALRDGAPRQPRLTAFGDDGGLSLLLEGAGGGRVVLGGSGARTGLGARLGRRLRPWDRRIDLLIVADARDLPGATDLVRHGDVRRAATLGLDGARGGAALAALREACAARQVPLTPIEGPQRVRLGRDPRDTAALTLDIAPAEEEGGGALIRLTAGDFTAAIVTGATTAAPPATAAIATRGAPEVYAAALAANPGLVVAPAPFPAAKNAATAPPLLVIGRGDRATFAIERSGRALRLRGPAVQSTGVPAAMR